MLLIVQGTMDDLDEFFQREKHQLPPFVYRQYRKLVFEGEAWSEEIKTRNKHLSFWEVEKPWNG